MVIGIVLSVAALKGGISLGGSGSVLVLDFNSLIAESSAGSFFEQTLTIKDIVFTLEKAAGDNSIDGVILRFSNPGLGMGSINDIRDAIFRFKESGKKVYAFLEFPSLWTYYAATSADVIILAPTSWFNTLGLRAEPTYYKGTMDKLGVEAEVHHVGDYKTAYETFKRESMSDEERESIESLLTDIYDWVVTEIAKQRGLTIEDIKTAIDTAPLTAARALELKLVDRVIYFDELESLIEEALGEKPTLVKWHEYAQPGPGQQFTSFLAAKIAVINAEGPIYTGESAMSLFSGKTIGSQTMVQAIQSAREDSAIKAIILRIDSPGGSGLASDEIWREVQKTRGVKPIIASMSNIAASGGYYIAMGCDEIFVQPTAITGSIGVISAKFVMKGLYEKLGMNKELVKKGKNADMFSDNQPFTEEQATILMTIMEDFYWEFVKKAALGREMTEQQVHEVAQGRVWSGKRAKELGLVSHFGGLYEAVQSAKTSAGLAADARIELVNYPKPKGLMGLLGAGATAQSISPELAETLTHLSLMEYWNHEQVLALMPYQLTVE